MMSLDSCLRLKARNRSSLESRLLGMIRGFQSQIQTVLMWCSIHTQVPEATLCMQRQMFSEPCIQC